MEIAKIDKRIFLRPATLGQLAMWLKGAKAGRWICYWEGDLRYDRWHEEQMLRRGRGGSPDDPSSYPARIVGPWMMEQAALGRVSLWQKRIGPLPTPDKPIGNFMYLARKEPTA